MFSFAKYISSRKIKITNMQFFNFEKEVNVELYAERNGDSFSLRYKGQEIIFETDSKIFKKGMFMAYVVRSIRFPEVSNRLPLLNLFKRKLPLVSSNLHKLTINLDGKKYILVKNGISFNKYSFINKCWYFKDFLFKRSDCYIGRTICNINEALFEKGRMDFTKKK